MTVAALFFGNVFGTAAERAMSVLVALRYVSCSCVPVLFAECFDSACWPPTDGFIRRCSALGVGVDMFDVG